jgi:hypothetical protein
LAAIAGRHFTLAAASMSILGHEPSHPRTPVIALWNAIPASLTGSPVKRASAMQQEVRESRTRQLDPIGKSGRSGSDEKLGCRHHDRLRPRSCMSDGT